MDSFIKKYAEAFAIFAKYEALYDSPEFDYGWMCVYFAGPFSSEDHARLLELGWEDASSSTYETFAYRAEG